MGTKPPWEIDTWQVIGYYAIAIFGVRLFGSRYGKSGSFDKHFGLVPIGFKI